jgi:DNA gyrase/topoisomerase IV subunit B
MTESTRLDPQDIAASVVRALVLYSLAEFQSGHATTVRVTAEGHSFSVADDGRGHAIDRKVDGQPYLQFVYTHLDYPFEQGQSAPVQLHAIGISLVNVLCSELSITARKLDAMLRMSFINGQLGDYELVDAKSSETGNTISGKVNSQLQKTGVDIHSLRQWLIDLLAASPTLSLFLNDVELQALARPGELI